MKRLILILAAFAAMTLAQAQDNGFKKHTVKWFEDLNVISAKYDVPVEVLKKVNALSGDKLTARQVLLIPISPDYWDVVAVVIEEPVTETAQDTGALADVAAAVDTVKAAPLLNPESIEEHKTVKMAVVLPFNSENEAANKNSIELYCGVLMAVREAGRQGIDITLDALDYTSELNTLSYLYKDVVIGPISASELDTVLSVVDSTTIVVSSLDRKADQLLPDHRNLVQAAPATTGVYGSAIRWAKQENELMGIPANFILLSDAADSTAMSDALESFRQEGISEFKTCTCGTSAEIEGWDNAYDHRSYNVVIAAITNEAILNNAIRNMRILMRTQDNIVLMCNNKVISFDSIPLEDIHKSNTHSLCPYYIDYTNEQTLDFIHQYRAFFNAEPSRFAFQGYDVAMFIAKTFSKLGSKWNDYISYYPEMSLLQTNFKLKKLEDGGYVNIGERRVVLGPDYKVLLVK